MVSESIIIIAVIFIICFLNSAKFRLCFCKGEKADIFKQIEDAEDRFSSRVTGGIYTICSVETKDYGWFVSYHDPTRGGWGYTELERPSSDSMEIFDQSELTFIHNYIRHVAERAESKDDQSGMYVDREKRIKSEKARREKQRTKYRCYDDK